MRICNLRYGSGSPPSMVYNCNSSSSAEPSRPSRRFRCKPDRTKKLSAVSCQPSVKTPDVRQLMSDNRCWIADSRQLVRPSCLDRFVQLMFRGPQMFFRLRAMPGHIVVVRRAGMVHLFDRFLRMWRGHSCPRSLTLPFDLRQVLRTRLRLPMVVLPVSY